MKKFLPGSSQWLIPIFCAGLLLSCLKNDEQSPEPSTFSFTSNAKACSDLDAYVQDTSLYYVMAIKVRGVNLDETFQTLEIGASPGLEADVYQLSSPNDYGWGPFCMDLFFNHYGDPIRDTLKIISGSFEARKYNSRTDTAKPSGAITRIYSVDLHMSNLIYLDGAGKKREIKRVDLDSIFVGPIGPVL
ncbi:MAG TPA: hypothetical protein DCQ83_07535 [Fibrobacteres bacterium]|jgi:hypothetical protein|nr:hypothetical protein [Fibrobacterota bacterium]